ncbi:hypothetical protein D3C87_1768560 [compost metagenome]
MQVDADAHEELHRAEREVEGAREDAEGLGGEMKVRLQRARHDGADGAEGLAERNPCAEGEDHDPGGSGCQGLCCRTHEVCVFLMLLFRARAQATGYFPPRMSPGLRPPP